jgi:hypothetical protein
MTMHDRVRAHTSAEVNRSIRRQTARRVAQLDGRPDAIRARLREIDAEWDVERALELLSSGLSLGGVALALSRGRPRLLAFPAVVQGFLLLHALQGWCPPLPLLRRLGFRTQQEIERERYTLRALLRDHVLGPSDRPAELPARGVPVATA